MSSFPLRLTIAVSVLAAATSGGGSALGRAYTPPGGHVFAGLSGGTTITKFERMVGKHPPVFETYMTWNTPTRWLAVRNSPFRARLALHLSTSTGHGRPGVITPLAIARGASDDFLIGLGHNLALSGRIAYVRVMAEMNGYWNAYAPFGAHGESRGRENSAGAYIRAWRRTVLILRGGAVARINQRLRRLHLPPLRVRHRLRWMGVGPLRGLQLPRPKVAFLWVPQDAGSPDIAGNRPANFWPGAAYVDWVGTDFFAPDYFSLLERFYHRFGGKPFVLSEWALSGRDDPGFVRKLFAWVRRHPRVRMLNYYQGFNPGSPVNLGHYPRSRARLRRELRSRRFLAFAPEYSHRRYR